MSDGRVLLAVLFSSDEPCPDKSQKDLCRSSTPAANFGNAGEDAEDPYKKAMLRGMLLRRIGLAKNGPLCLDHSDEARDKSSPYLCFSGHHPGSHI
jgi:hypothetical protein